MQWIHPVNEIYFGLPGNFLMWIMVIIGLSAFALILFKRYRLIRSGKSDPRFSNLGERVIGLLKEGILQRRQPRYPLAGIPHILIFWGFVILGLHSVDLIVGGLSRGHTLYFLDGSFGAVYNSLKDVFVLVVLTACTIAVYHRAVVRPKRYRDSRQVEAYLVLGLIIFLMLSDMFYEGTKLYLGNPSPGFLLAAQVSKTVLSSAGSETIRIVNSSSFWLHILCFFFFLNLLPLSKHFHIITALPSVFFKSLHPGTLKPPRWDVRDIECLDAAGVKTHGDFTWKHILDFYTCTECGRCTDNCPAYEAGKPLSPKMVTMNLRDFGYKTTSLFKKNDLMKKSIPGEVIQDETFWSCTTCGACERECPVFIEHIDKIVELRRGRVLMDSTFPPEIEQIYRNLEIYGNAWGMGPALRSDWARGLSVKTVQSADNADVLYWVGCAGSFDLRVQQVAVSFIKILQKAGVNYATLGIEERCCGDFARRTGNEYLFQALAKKNIEILHKHNIKKIVVSCPHGYNTLKNEYPQLGGNFEVVHATEFILELIHEGRLPSLKEMTKTVVYHDPCYLGRHNGLYEIPRKIFSSIPGVVIVEAERHKDKSFCCGAGGGHFWMKSSGSRINDIRTAQLLEKSPEMLATGCPYCLIMINDGIESKELQSQVPVRDIIEVVADLI